MNGQPLGAAWTTCGNCGLPLKNHRAVCKGCGSVVPFERVSKRIRTAIQRRASAPGNRQDQSKLTLWVLAIVPFLIAPPLLAIVLAWKRRGASDQVTDIDPTFLTIVAIGNVIFSVVLLVKFRHEALVLLDWFSTIKPSLDHAPAGNPKLTPI